MHVYDDITTSNARTRQSLDAIEALMSARHAARFHYGIEDFDCQDARDYMISNHTGTVFASGRWQILNVCGASGQDISVLREQAGEG